MIESAKSVAQRSTVWQQELRKLQSQPLKYCQAFPQVARRWNDWWRFQSDRPLIVSQVRKSSEIRWDKAFDLLEQPDEWVRIRRKQVEQTYYVGEAMPFVRVDIGPVAMAAFLGAPLHFSQKHQTSWQTPVIESWSDPMRWEIAPDNLWFKRVLLLMQKVAEDARGEYLVCLPDMTGAIDVLANMRGAEKLCFDLYEHRQDILSAAAQAVDAWEGAFSRMYDLVLGCGAGITQWVSAWADGPFTLPTCDFNALIGPADFREVCMPSLKEQARRAGLCVFHLDGPAAARHAETLAEDPDITAVQYSPGAGTPSALAMLPMFRMLQEHKVPILISECPLDEFRQLAQELDPRGVALHTSELNCPKEADALMNWREKVFA
jgi:hypothetical protein